MVVEILNNKSTYNTLELTSGRMAKVGKGDIVVGALGHRKALFGYSGHVPESVKPGDIIQMLNIGGVLGIVRLGEPRQGQAVRLPRASACVLHFPYLGERIGVPARVGYRAARLRRDARTRSGVPVVALAGTCMEAGKTAAACAIVARMRHRGLVVDAFKATGVSLRRDILAMEDAGARSTHDLHRPRHRHDHAQDRARRSRARMLTELSQGRSPMSSCSSSATACSAPTASTRSSSATDIAQGDHRRRAVRERPGRGVGRREAAARAVRHRADARSPVRPPTTPSACDIIQEQLEVPAFNALTAGAALGDCDHRVARARRRLAADRRPRRMSDMTNRFPPSCSAAPATWPASCCA